MLRTRLHFFTAFAAILFLSIKLVSSYIRPDLSPKSSDWESTEYVGGTTAVHDCAKVRRSKATPDGQL
jgi:hypothetical protein